MDYKNINGTDVDVVILSNTANVQYYNLLAECIDSIKKTSQANVIVVETNSKLKNKSIPLSIDKIIFPCEEFNYNAFLNKGINETTREKIIISNNDVIYEPNCILNLASALNSYDSVSPVDKNNSKHQNISTITEGAEVGFHVIGYSIGIKKTTLKRIGEFDENFTFWYQDNDYCNLLKKYKLKHALIPDAKCFHYGGVSHNLIPPEKIKDKTDGLYRVLKEKWNEYE